MIAGTLKELNAPEGTRLKCVASLGWWPIQGEIYTVDTDGKIQGCTCANSLWVVVDG